MSAFTRFGQSQFDSVSSSMASTPAFPLTSSDGLSAASREQAVFHSIEDDETLVKERVIHKPTADVNRPMETPDSVISSSSNRFILPSNGRPGTYVNAGGIQQNRNNLGRTMRDIFVTEGSTSNYDRIEETNFISEPVNPEENPAKKKRCVKRSCLKCLVASAVITVFVAAMVVLVVMRAKHAPEPEKLGGVIITTIRPEETTTNADNTIPCPDVNVKLQDMIVIKCPDLYSLNHVTKIALKPPLYMNEGKEIRVSIGEQANTSNEWVAVMDATSRLLTIKGPAASCRSTGKYRLHVQASEDMSLYNRTIDINVISEIKKVNISLSQDVTHNSTDYKIGCSTTSGCEQSFVDFFAEINQEEQFLRGVNFSCQITYDDFAGYRVECNGTIPDFLLAQFERITCKPRSKLLDHLNETEKRKLENDFPLVHCNITTHCGFKCKEAGDYYAVDTNRCDIFHRCYERQVYTSYCSPGTFFDPGDCACKHTTDLPWCRSDGGLNPENEITMKTCRTQ